jgi:cyclohexanecarboxylate-CoA ligase
MIRESMKFPGDRAEAFLADGRWKPETLDTLLARAVETKPDAVAIDHPGGQVSWREFSDMVSQAAAGLSSLGLAQGDVITTQMPNTLEFLISHLAIGRIGAVHQTIHLPYGPKDSEFHLNHAKAKAVIAPALLKDTDMGAVMLGLKAGLPDLDHVILVGDAPEGAVSFDSLMQTGTPPLTEGPSQAADPCMLLYTSGTTSSPKGVPLTFQMLLCNSLEATKRFGFTGDDRILSAAPFSHLYGIFNFHAALHLGATAVLLPIFTPPDLGQRINDTKPTVVFSAPAHAAAVQGMGLTEKFDFSSVRFTVFSGAACPVELLKSYQAKVPSSTVAQLWGMTELVAGCFTHHDDILEDAANTAGPAAPGNEVRVLTDDGSPTKPGDEGDLQIRGSSVFAGYLDNPDANDAAFTADGWFITGDLAIIDDRGYVKLTGRSKDIINRGGIKYNPSDIEELLLQHPALDQAAIVPMKDEVLGERACCFAVLKVDADAPALADICTYLESHDVSKYKWPERLEFVPEMPLTPTRKIIKGRLAALLDME